MDGDRPITSRAEDRLGFAPIAEKLARAIIDEAARDGLVFGIEGEWGTGKSTLINLAIEALASHGATGPEIVRFSPWLVGDREQLLHSLFDALATAVEKIDPIEAAVAAEEAKLPWWQNWRKAVMPWTKRQKHVAARFKKRVSASIRLFGAQAAPLGRLIKLGEYAAIPYSRPIGEALGRFGETAREFSKEPSLSGKKTLLEQNLRTLARRVVIIVDDLDRLEPAEIAEVLRLIRAVADFPNVLYVLSYDPKVVAKNLERALQLDNGAAFLEKIVQVSFKVPRPEAFDLRRWFHDEVTAIFADELASGEEAYRGVRQRFADAVDTQGGRSLKTPRDVVRALNALRLQAVPVRDLIDMADMVWLQLIRIGKPQLYEWIEQYLIDAAAVAQGATMEGGELPEIKQRLLELLAPHDDGITLSVINFEQAIPGVSIGPQNGRSEAEARIFQNLTSDALAPFVRDRRLGSPRHYRLYFAFAEPSGALKDAEVRAFVSLSETKQDEARERFAQLASTVRPQGGVMAEVLIDHLMAWADRIPPTAFPGIFGAFAFALDNVARKTPRDDFGEPSAWRAAGRAVALFLKKPGIDRETCLRALVEGRSIGWLTSVLRNEIFAHGLYGDRSEPVEQRLLTEQEFRNFLDAMLERYRTTEPEVLLNVPNLLSLLYGWLQGGGKDSVRQWVSARIVTDDGLLALLSRARGYSYSSTIGLHFPLKKFDIDHFMDFDNAEKRVRAIYDNLGASKEHRRLAKEIITAIEQGRGL